MENISGVIKRSYNIPVELCGTLGPNKSDSAKWTNHITKRDYIDWQVWKNALVV